MRLDSSDLWSNHPIPFFPGEIGQGASLEENDSEMQWHGEGRRPLHSLPSAMAPLPRPLHQTKRIPSAPHQVSKDVFCDDSDTNSESKDDQSPLKLKILK